MGSTPPLLTWFLTVVSGCVHRRQLLGIEYLRAENRAFIVVFTLLTTGSLTDSVRVVGIQDGGCAVSVP